MATFERFDVEGMTVLTRTLTERNAQGEFEVKENLSPVELVKWVKAQFETGEYDPRFWDLKPLQVEGQTVDVDRYNDEDGDYISITHGFDSFHSPYGKEILSGTSAEISVVYFETLAD